ncbi:2OG-Fe(II) oxygenase family protein [Fretibacter rubidus]|uniref:2OG-Fe(II) oxygenase n=1 Tax=Fretibacter rubidus TaxID=570162 RepID=UPI00352A09EE
MSRDVTDIINFAALSAQQKSLTGRFAAAGRIRIDNVLHDNVSMELLTALKVLDWRLVMNDAHGRHVDISPSEQKRLGAKAIRQLKTQAQKRALSQFSYLYENYPLYDRVQQKLPVPKILSEIFTALSHETFITYMREVTGKGIDYCDIQATRYRSGHMLTEHDDNVSGKNRHCAYVLSMCAGWQRKWGGNLEFLEPNQSITDTFVPQFNALSIFAVPVPHRVSKVRPGVLASRYSLTGWMRHH